MSKPDKNLLIDIFSIPKPQKKKRNTRFNKLERRLEAKRFWLEKAITSYGRYELGSNDIEPGTTTICMTLNEVEGEVMSIENKY